MKANITKIDFTKLFATCLMAHLILGGPLTSPRLFGSVVVICVVLVLATRSTNRINN